MPKARKTVEVEAVRHLANHMIEHSPPEAVKEREAIAALTRRLLHDTYNYNGFRYTRTAGCHDRGDWKVLDESYIRFF